MRGGLSSPANISYGLSSTKTGMAIVVTPRIHGQELPAVVLGAQTEKARRLHHGFAVRPLEAGIEPAEQPIIADPATIHVVIARERIDRQLARPS
jgi:hypothetical protein